MHGHIHNTGFLPELNHESCLQKYRRFQILGKKQQFMCKILQTGFILLFPKHQYISFFKLNWSLTSQQTSAKPLEL